MKKNNLISWIVILIFGLVYGYVGYRYTFYSVGIYLIPFVLLLGVISAFSAALAKRSWRHLWWPIFNWTSSGLFIVLITVVAIDNYKPTYVIYVPNNFEGTVYLFPAKEMSSELYIDEYGIGYYNPGREVDVKVYHGDENSSNALNEYGDRTLIFPLGDSTHYESFHITCFEVEKSKTYGNSPWNQQHAKCMDETEFKRLVAAGIIDESRIEKEVYPRILDSNE